MNLRSFMAVSKMFFFSIVLFEVLSQLGGIDDTICDGYIRWIRMFFLSFPPLFYNIIIFFFAFCVQNIIIDGMVCLKVVVEVEAKMAR